MNSSEAKALDSPLGAFLRARRQQVRPQQQDLVPGGSRQVVGLRRDEVAMLAGISADYYVRLEQGRERHPSSAVLDGLSTALLLDRASTRYLRELTNGHQIWAYHPADDATREALVRLASLATLSDPEFTRRDESTS